MIPVSKPYLPERSKLDKYLDRIYETHWLTNNGELLRELERRLASHLNIDKEQLILVANGSLALHLAYKALGLKGEVITSPFSFIATASTIKWEGLEPIFAEIDSGTWNLDPASIEKRISSHTSAIVPVHVFGNPCDVTAIQSIADKYQLKVVYDASHCFDIRLGGESVLMHGDISTISFHATKLFHTVEGGAIVTKSKALAEKIRKMINFGIGEPYKFDCIGTNAKLNEFQAAMGLAMLDEIDNVQSKRAHLWDTYADLLSNRGVGAQVRHEDANSNHAYFPVVLKSDHQVVEVINLLEAEGIQARRYFYPSLDTIDYLGAISRCEISNDIASRILCLPLWPDLKESEVRKITDLVQEVVDK